MPQVASTDCCRYRSGVILRIIVKNLNSFLITVDPKDLDVVAVLAD